MGDVECVHEGAFDLDDFVSGDHRPPGTLSNISFLERREFMAKDVTTCRHSSFTWFKNHVGWKHPDALSSRHLRDNRLHRTVYRIRRDN